VRSGTAEQVALRLVAAFAAEQIELIVGLDAFGKDRDFQALAER
jgi:hypothetical protein